MPRVLVDAIARLVYEAESEARMREILRMALHANQYGYDGPVSELVAGVCQRLREAVADEQDPRHKARLERTIAGVYELI